MNRHSFWCSIDKAGTCDCGYAELLEARHILLQIHNEGPQYLDDRNDDWVCFFCGERDELSSNREINIEHNKDCAYLKTRNYLEKNNAR